MLQTSSSRKCTPCEFHYDLSMTERVCNLRFEVKGSQGARRQRKHLSVDVDVLWSDIIAFHQEVEFFSHELRTLKTFFNTYPDVWFQSYC